MSTEENFEQVRLLFYTLFLVNFKFCNHYYVQMISKIEHINPLIYSQESFQNIVFEDLLTVYTSMNLNINN